MASMLCTTGRADRPTTARSGAHHGGHRHHRRLRLLVGHHVRAKCAMPPRRLRSDLFHHAILEVARRHNQPARPPVVQPPPTRALCAQPRLDSRLLSVSLCAAWPARLINACVAMAIAEAGNGSPSLINDARVVSDGRLPVTEPTRPPSQPRTPPVLACRRSSRRCLTLSLCILDDPPDNDHDHEVDCVIDRAPPPPSPPLPIARCLPPRAGTQRARPHAAEAPPKPLDPLSTSLRSDDVSVLATASDIDPDLAVDIDCILADAFGGDTTYYLRQPSYRDRAVTLAIPILHEPVAPASAIPVLYTPVEPAGHKQAMRSPESAEWGPPPNSPSSPTTRGTARLSPWAAGPRPTPGRQSTASTSTSTAPSGPTTTRRSAMGAAGHASASTAPTRSLESTTMTKPSRRLSGTHPSASSWPWPSARDLASTHATTTWSPPSYRQGSLQPTELIVMRFPPGYKTKGANGHQRVYLVQKPIYGLKQKQTRRQAGRRFQKDSLLGLVLGSPTHRDDGGASFEQCFTALQRAVRLHVALGGGSRLPRCLLLLRRHHHRLRPLQCRFHL